MYTKDSFIAGPNTNVNVLKLRIFSQVRNFRIIAFLEEDIIPGVINESKYELKPGICKLAWTG